MGVRCQHYFSHSREVHAKRLERRGEEGKTYRNANFELLTCWRFGEDHDAVAALPFFSWGFAFLFVDVEVGFEVAFGLLSSGSASYI